MLSLFREAVGPGLRLLLSLIFRRIEVFGARRVPVEGPLILVTRGGDPFLDALLLQVAAPRPVVPLARRERFAGPFGGPLLRAFRALPLGLTWDAHASAVNAETASRCEHLLLDGRALALCLTGQRTGEKESSREVVLTAVEAVSSRGVAVLLLPVALRYSWGGAGRGLAAVVFGHPRAFEAGRAPAAGAGDTRPALSESISKALGETQVLSDFGEDVDLLERLAGMTGGRLESATEGLSERYLRARLDSPLLTRRLLAASKRYFGLLGGLGIPDAAVAARGEGVRVPDLTYFRVFLALAGLPAALYGWLFHALPYALSKWAAGPRENGEGAPSALRAAGGALLIFPLFYAVQTWALAEALGWWRAALCLAAAPPAGLWFLAYGGVRRRFLITLACLLRWRLPGRLGRALLAERDGLQEAMEPLGSLFSPRQPRSGDQDAEPRDRT